MSNEKAACNAVGLVSRVYDAHFLPSWEAAGSATSSLYTTGSDERSHGSGGVLKNCSNTTRVIISQGNIKMC
jgi:hypothetical protein